MEIIRHSTLTGKMHAMDLNVTEEQIAKFNYGMLVQEAFPQLTPGEREFILNGITPEEWIMFFGDGIEDEDDYDYYDNEVEYKEYNA